MERFSIRQASPGDSMAMAPLSAWMMPLTMLRPMGRLVAPMAAQGLPVTLIWCPLRSRVIPPVASRMP